MTKTEKSKKIIGACARCRRVQEKLLLKGEKCLSPKCPLIKRSYPPGQHGPKQKRTRASGFGQQLREKQKVKGMYGILERQFANYVAEAAKKTGDTSKYLLAYLESRLDNVIYRMGAAPSRPAARQIVKHRFIAVNGRRVDIPSYRVRVSDVITFREKKKSKKNFAFIQERLTRVEPPAWLGVNPQEENAKILNTPTIENPNFNAKSIIEFYSR